MVQSLFICLSLVFFFLITTKFNEIIIIIEIRSVVDLKILIILKKNTETYVSSEDYNHNIAALCLNLNFLLYCLH